MIKTELCILGAGFAGVGVGYAAEQRGEQAILFEQDDDWGGLCGNFVVDGFRFDKAVHLSFANDELCQSIFFSKPHFEHAPESTNYVAGAWVRHPAQNNLRSLPVDERVKIIQGFVNRVKEKTGHTYQDWLHFAFGDYFAEHYPERYTRKYWGTEAAELSDTWCGNRIYQPDLQEVLRGSYPDSERPANVYYAKKMNYPTRGGYKSFLADVAAQIDVRYGYCVVRIDAATHVVEFANGERCHYHRLVSTLPLPEMPALLGLSKPVRDAAEHLQATSMVLVSVGFRREIAFPALWFYVYDEDIPFARVHSPSMKSADNAPVGCSSLQFEVYYSQERPLTCTDAELMEQVLASMERMGLATRADVQTVDCRHVRYANVIYYLGMERYRAQVRAAVEVTGVHTCGRFGEWGYLWSDQSFLSGVHAIQ